MELVIVGLQASGKTRLFEALTGAHGASGGKTAGIGTLQVPDERVDALTRLSDSAKKTYVSIGLRDSQSLSTDPSGKQYNDRILGDLRDADGLLLMVRVFQSAVVPHPMGDLNPIRDAETILNELHLSDLGIIEKRLDKLEVLIPREPKAERELHETERTVLRKIQESIEEGNVLDMDQFSTGDLLTVKGYRFFSLKPTLLLANCGDLSSGHGQEAIQRLREWAQPKGIPVIPVNADLEAELLEFPEDDRATYYKEMGLPGSGLASLVQGAYQKLDLVTYLTTGPKESHAWAIPRGSNAKKAAGAIHSDIEQGFIRAEVIGYKELLECGSEAEAKRAGLIRKEGKDYIVQEGDVMLFHFSK